MHWKIAQISGFVLVHSVHQMRLHFSQLDWDLHGTNLCTLLYQVWELNCGLVIDFPGIYESSLATWRTTVKEQIPAIKVEISIDRSSSICLSVARN
ncbi:hypothetical protein PRIPAC_88591 [Pristionchus pacificus]|uniref:Uncharacterized protein n=1 Tax=Pristionchus pacificus TaxID=54126 RepID=A0A2A6CXQ3_PRIPA|nr:hypothetical protein PRIPAC_88591 [Pristionchus pacificus]|eukprot:PDM82880.1 hypothetical protein PRIPAC_37273 [Pristionchus pacificus]